MTETIYQAERDTEVLFVNDQGDYETLAAGGIRLDSTPRTKALLALKARRGQYWSDPNYGSRFHAIETLRDAERLALPYTVEALQFMLDSGEIIGVEVSAVQQNPTTGTALIHVVLTVTEDDIVDIIVQRELP
ncbi:MAG TPA: hypothetical protein ENL34_03555 [Chloroflexi bacterium]|nr:hypothetical protein [Chloroflexota bacterium]